MEINVTAEMIENGNVSDDIIMGCIPSGANKEDIVSVVIPRSYTGICDFMFMDCYSLGRVIIPNSVTTVGDSAFKYCINLANITIPSSVTKIGVEAFYGCRSLKSIEIPSSVMWIGENVFGGCHSLKSFVVDKDFKTKQGQVYNQLKQECPNIDMIVKPYKI